MSRSALRGAAFAIIILGFTAVFRYGPLIQENASSGISGVAGKEDSVGSLLRSPRPLVTEPPSFLQKAPREAEASGQTQTLKELAKRYEALEDLSSQIKLLKNIPVWPAVKGFVFGNKPMAIARDLQFVLHTNDEKLSSIIDMFKESVLVRRIQPSDSGCSKPEARQQDIKATGVLKTILVTRMKSGYDEVAIIPVKSNERYRIYFDDELNAGIIDINSRFGLMRALSTLVQLITPDSSSSCGLSTLSNLLTPALIDDEPAFNHRGVLIDTARNYYSVDSLLRIVRTLAMTKMNVMHWHFADDQSYGFESKAIPEITLSGYLNESSKVYSFSDIKLVVEEGRKWGVRIIPELDMPSHAGGWIGVDKHDPNDPEKILAQCPNYACRTAWGIPLNPYSSKTWIVIEKLLKELVQLFPDPVIHLGGDEVSEQCWQEDPSIASNSYDKRTVWSYFEAKLKDVVKSIDRKLIRWAEDAMSYYGKAGEDRAKVMYQMWLSDEWLREAMAAGYDAFPSMGWYLDVDCFSWKDCYRRNPLLRERQRPHNTYNHPHAIGLEACAWELTEENLDSENLWMRFLGIGEQMWSFTGNGTQRQPLDFDTDGSTEHRIGSLCHLLSFDMKLFPQSMCSSEANLPKENIRNSQGWLKRGGYRESMLCGRMSDGKLPCSTPACIREGFSATQAYIQPLNRNDARN